MRTKEDAHDYRYFPDPDLPPLVVDSGWVDRVRANMPELPAARRGRFQTELGLTAYDAAPLTMQRSTADYFEEIVQHLPQGSAKPAANWVLGELAAALNRDDLDITQSPVSAQQMAALITRIVDGTISNKIARDVFAAMWEGEHNRDADAIIEARGLKQITDTKAIEAMVDQVLADHPAIVDEYRSGKDKAFNSLVGQVMRAARGKANPQQVTNILREKLDS